MAANRKRQTTAARFAPAVKAAVAVLLIGGSAVGYVWQKEQIGKLGRAIKDREARLAELREGNTKLRKQLATLRSPGVIERRVREMRLGLAQPSPDQVVRLVEVPAGLPSTAAALVAERRGPEAMTRR